MTDARTQSTGRRAADAAERRDPMGDQAAEAALRFLLDNAETAGVAKAQVVYLENFRKSTLARLRRAAPERTADGRDSWARAHPEYLEVINAQMEAVAAHETLFWKRIQAEATLDAWRTRNANNRGAGRMS